MAAFFTLKFIYRHKEFSVLDFAISNIHLTEERYVFNKFVYGEEKVVALLQRQPHYLFGSL